MSPATALHIATHCNTLQQCANKSHCNTLQHTATYCNTLQHTAAIREDVGETEHVSIRRFFSEIDVTLQHTATRCNTLQQTATQCNTMQRDVSFLQCKPTNSATRYITLQHTATLPHSPNPRTQPCSLMSGKSHLYF